MTYIGQEFAKIIYIVTSAIEAEIYFIYQYIIVNKHGTYCCSINKTCSNGIQSFTKQKVEGSQTTTQQNLVRICKICTVPWEKQQKLQDQKRTESLYFLGFLKALICILLCRHIFLIIHLGFFIFPLSFFLSTWCYQKHLMLRKKHLILIFYNNLFHLYRAIYLCYYY